MGVNCSFFPDGWDYNTTVTAIELNAWGAWTVTRGQISCSFSTYLVPDFPYLTVARILLFTDRSCRSASSFNRHDIVEYITMMFHLIDTNFFRLPFLFFLSRTVSFPDDLNVNLFPPSTVNRSLLEPHSSTMSQPSFPLNPFR